MIKPEINKELQDKIKNGIKRMKKRSEERKKLLAEYVEKYNISKEDEAMIYYEILEYIEEKFNTGEEFCSWYDSGYDNAMSNAVVAIEREIIDSIPDVKKKVAELLHDLKNSRWF
jgi:hypothetical protein